MGNSDSTPPSPDDAPKGHKLSVGDCGGLGLTPHQLRYVRKLWSMAKTGNKAEPGRSILVRVFHKAPELEQVFTTYEPSTENPHLPLERRKTVSVEVEPTRTSHLSMPLESKRRAVSTHEIRVFEENGLLTQHAEGLSATIDGFIRHLDDLPTAEQPIAGFGEQCAIMQPLGFKTKHWDVFAECMMEETLAWGNRKMRQEGETYDAWSKIVLHLVRVMRTAYNDALSQKRRSSKKR